MTLRRVGLVVLGCVAALFVLGVGLDLAGYVAPTDAPPPHVISGSFTLVDDATAANGCVGPSDGNWREVHPGATVWVRNDLRSWSGALGAGTVETWGQFREPACTYEFSIGVPDQERYTIEYPGGLTSDYTFAELEAKGWAVGAACCTIVPGS